VLDGDPSCAAVTPALVLPSGALQSGVGGFDISLITAFNYFFLLSRLFPAWFRGFYISQDAFVGRTDEIVIDWVCGAAMLVRTEALRAVGGVPADYFMYAEDIRLCRMLRKAGHVIKYVPSAKLLHVHGGTSEAKQVSTRWVSSTLTECGAISNPTTVQLMKLIFAAGFFVRSVAYAAGAAVTRSADYRRRASAMWAYCKASLAFRSAS
jgi:GT2 family glycosyltransferase